MLKSHYNIFICICMLFVLGGCRVGTSVTVPCEEDPRCLIYGITSDILILDPHVSNSIEAGIIFRQLYDTLVYRDPTTGDFLPGLAQSWEQSDDGLVYTFYLRQDVVFHDNSAFTSESVAKNIDRIFNADINSQKARLLLGSFSRYEIVDDYTIKFYLFELYVPFLDGLAQPFLGFASSDSLDNYTNQRYQFHQVGTGPFQLDNYLPGERIELSRNLVYAWGTSIYEPLLGVEINRIVFKIMSDPVLRGDALINREIDVVGEMLTSDASILANNSSIQLLPIDIPGQTVQFQFNTTQTHTDQLAVRKALLYATNRIAIIDAVFLNYSPIAWAPLSQSTQFAHTGYVNEYSYNVSISQDLLENVGYQDTDGDGFLDLGGERLELTIIVPPWGQLPEVAGLLRSQWRSIGIDLIIDPVPGLNSLGNRLATGEYHLAPSDIFGYDPSVLNSSFITNSPSNITGFENEKLDRLLIQAAQEEDTLARRSKYFEAQSIIMQEALTLPIRGYVNINGIQSNIVNLRFDAYGWYPLLYNVIIQ
jgi:peptide/nickel transport system substrate-binding protein